ncbi:hypothetical protein EC988_005076, partial [Linderina pennispora]
MAIRSLCLCASTESLFRDWVVTLNALVANRQPVSTLPLFERWRMITINRQWWESDTSGDAATDALTFVENAFIASRTSPLTTAPPSNASSTLALSAVSHDVPPPIARAMSRPASPVKQLPHRLGSMVGLRALQLHPLLPPPPPPPLTRTLEMVPQSVGCCDEVVNNLVDAAIMCQARPDVAAIYRNLVTSALMQEAAKNSLKQRQHRVAVVPSTGFGDKQFRIGDDDDNDEDDGEDEFGDFEPSIYTDSAESSVHRPSELTLPMFARFVREEQDEQVSDAEAERRFDAFTRTEGQETMTPFEFEAYLLSLYNSMDYVEGDYASSLDSSDGRSTLSEHAELANMNEPLNHYYIASSHNT